MVLTPTKHIHVERVMGTVVTFDVRGEEPCGEAIRAAVAGLHRADAAFSTFRPGSAVRRLGRGELQLRDASADMRWVVARCEQLRQQTGGFFDAGATGVFDPSALVKGWAVQRAADELLAAGAERFCLNAGGDVVAVGRPEPGRCWRVGIRHPRDPQGVARIAAARRRRPGRARGLGLGITIALGITAESAGSLSAPGGVTTAIGRMAGLLAAYAMVVVVVLVARIPPLERAIGQDRLVAWHRRLGPWPLYLLLAHAIFITIGYARAAHDGVLHQIGQLLWTYPGVLAATAGGILLIAAGVTSYRLARRRMAYETWWTVHLYTYLALFLSSSHQVGTGASFVGHPVARAWWTALWIGTLALVVAARIGLPIWRSLHHRLRVAAVVPEGPGTVSVVMEGRHLDRLPIHGGQFFQWRFLLPGQWWQAHPYSISAVPAAGRIRITVKDLGDHSRFLATLTPGTRVGIEGPYGVFTGEARQSEKVVLVGAGVGSAPILAVLQDLPSHADVVVVLRGSTAQELILRDEIADEVRRRGGRLAELPGSRQEVPLSAQALRA